MNDLISRHAVMNRIENEYRKWGDEYDVSQILGDIEDLPSAEAIPVSWIEERIENAIKANHALIAQMWLELIVGYMKERKEE